MAYISTPEVKLIRETLKQAYPDFKFSVRRDNHISVDVSVVSGPIELEVNRGDINQYHLDTLYEGKTLEFLKGIDKIIRMAPVRQHYDKSDALSDYFNVAYYYHISVGKFNKEYEVKAKKLRGDDNYIRAADTALAVNAISKHVV
jgi:hypothetical protein